MADLKFVNINKVYDNNVQAVFDFNLEVKDKEFIVFVGPSGCGKSTTLRMLAGLEEITAGELYIDGELVNEVHPKNRDIAMVFQNYALYPHMTVYDNMAFGLKLRKFEKEEIKERVEKAAEILGLTEYLNRKPKALSGGQRQRVALGRAIVRSPKVFLMDEPLSNLDAKLRVQMRSEITKIHQQVGATTIYVTHDQTEAMTMADRVVIMKDGYIQQIGTPKEIYNNPQNIFVATFIGAPAMNILPCVYEKGKATLGDGTTLKVSKDMMKLHDEYFKNQIQILEDEIEECKNDIKDIEKDIAELVKPRRKEIKALNEEHEEFENKLLELEKELEKVKGINEGQAHQMKIGVRPEDIYVHGDEKNLHPSPAIKLTCDVSELLGRELIVYSNIEQEKIIIKTTAQYDIAQGNTNDYCIDLSKIVFFDERTGKRVI